MCLILACRRRRRERLDGHDTACGGRQNYVLNLEDIDGTQLALAGGKGASLGELSRVEGVRVPPGFCVTADAFRRIVAPAIEDRLDRLSLPSRTTATGSAPRAVRSAGPSKRSRSHAIWRRRSPVALDEQAAYAVRSSATAEDLPTASFAGQQDTYLNVIGTESVLAHVRRCWASLFTDRAVTYRLQNGIDHGRVQMAVVIQRMVFPQVAGILFTADPIASNRKVSSIDASFGLGEALVSGLVNADTYRVRDAAIVDKKVSTKRLMILPVKGSSTTERAIETERQNDPALTDAQIVQLERLGRTIEAHFGRPQDIEWCLADDEIRSSRVDQSRHSTRSPAASHPSPTSTSPSVTRK